MSGAEIVLKLAQFEEPQQAWEIFEDIYLNAKQPYEKKVGYRYPAHSGWVLAKNYLHDLNAVHEVEMKLGPVKWNLYTHYLEVVVRDPETEMFKSGAWQGINPSRLIDACLVHATARQRCEALIRVINPT